MHYQKTELQPLPDRLHDSRKDLFPICLSEERKGRYYFLLMPKFSLLALSSLLETLQVANQIAGRDLFRWSLVAEGNQGVRCSVGSIFPVDSGLPTVTQRDSIFVCAAENIETISNHKVESWLRRADRAGAVVGGLCTGSHVLARAGMMSGKRATIHWRNYDCMMESFSDTILTDNLFEIDGRRFSTTGATSSIDLALHLIQEEVGAELANDTAEHLIYNDFRQSRRSQTTSVADRRSILHPKLRQVVREMGENLEVPLSRDALAAHVNISTRQLERIFSIHLGRSPARYYIDLRLQKAENLVQQTSLSIIEIAMSCGFGSSASFSKLYKQRLGLSPFEHRKLALLGVRRPALNSPTS